MKRVAREFYYDTGQDEDCLEGYIPLYLLAQIYIGPARNVREGRRQETEQGDGEGDACYICIFDK